MKWRAMLCLCAVLAGALGYKLITDRLAARTPAHPIHATGRPPDAVLVEAATAVRGDVRRALPLTGVLRAEKEVTVSVPLPGRLVELSVSEGSRVTAGQQIARILSPELEAQVAQARAGVDTARSRLSQAVQGTPLKSVERETQITQAEQNVAAARARLSQAEEGARMAVAEADADIQRAQAGVDAAKAQLASVQNSVRPEQVKQAEAQLEQAQVAYNAAKAGLKRAQFLYDRGGLPRARLEEAQAGCDAAKAQVDAAQQGVALAKAGATPEQVQMAKDQVRQADAGLAAAKAGSHRKEVSQHEVDAARTQVKQAEAALEAAKAARGEISVQRQDVAAARAGLAQAEAGLSAAQAQLAATNVRAPVSGVVSRTGATAGEAVMPGTPLATIVSLSGVYFEAVVSARDRASLTPGLPARIEVAGAAKPVVVAGRVRDSLPVAEADNRSFRVRISLEPSAATLTPGAFASGEVELYHAPQALLLPQEALVGQEDRWYVLRVDGDHVRRQEVTTGATQDGRIEIRSGLQGGERVVVNPGTLSDGDAVRVAPDDPKKGTGQ